MNVKILIAIIMFNFYATILSMQDRQFDLNHELISAIETDDIAKVNELLAQGANPNFKIHGNFTPLHDAAIKGNLVIVQTLLDHGANPKSKTITLTTPLHLAAENGDSASALALLRKGAAINASDQFERTPLHEAAKNNHAGTIDVLFMKKGANVNAQDHFSETPLIKAIEYHGSDCDKIVQKLLDKGADPDIKNHDGNTALHEAARLRTPNILKILLTKCPDPFITNYEKKKASDVAKNPLIKEMLTQYEADYCKQNLENLEIFSQRLRTKRGYKPGDAFEAFTTEVSKYL